MHLIDEKWQTGFILETDDSQDSNKRFQRTESTENKDMASV